MGAYPHPVRPETTRHSILYCCYCSATVQNVLQSRTRSKLLVQLDLKKLSQVQKWTLFTSNNSHWSSGMDGKIRYRQNGPHEHSNRIPPIPHLFPRTDSKKRTACTFTLGCHLSLFIMRPAHRGYLCLEKRCLERRGAGWEVDGGSSARQLHIHPLRLFEI